MVSKEYDVKNKKMEQLKANKYASWQRENSYKTETVPDSVYR